jgi:hypothetical protein
MQAGHAIKVVIKVVKLHHCCSACLTCEWKAVSLHACTGESLSVHVLGFAWSHAQCL